jgi:hypothetical protein
MSSLLAGSINAQDTIDTLKTLFPIVEENKGDTFQMIQDVEDIRMEQRTINQEMDNNLDQLKKLLEKRRKEDEGEN